MQRSLLCVAIATAAFSPISHALDDGLMLEEVIVTAQKRAESIQDVPLSVTAMSGEKIEKSGISDLSELSAYVPNLNIAEGTVSTNIYMRGMGSGINRAFEQSVGMFIDGIYMGRGRQFRSPFLDLERAEVLRGPQGILFGKNTIAGTLNLTTAKPEVGEVLNGQVSLEYEPEYNTQVISGYVTGSLNDEFALRLAIKDSRSDGYIENTRVDRDGPETEEQIARLTFTWEPSDELKFTGKLERDEFESLGTSVQVTHFDPLDPLAGFMASVIPTLDPNFETRADHRKSSDDELADDSRWTQVDNAVVTIEYALGEHTLTLVSGYSAYESSDRQEVDFGPVPFLATNDDHDYTQWSQEIRLTSPGGETFDYITGIYWQGSDFQADFWSDVDIATINPVLQAVYGSTGAVDPTQAVGPGNPSLSDVGLAPTPFSRDTAFEQDVETLSAFFQGTWSITENVRLIGGVRYTHETKEATRRSAITRFQDLNTPAGMQEVVMATALKVNVTLPQFEGKRTEKQFTPSLKLQWDVNEDVMVYASAEKGFKGGGFNANPDATLENQEFEEESALGLEVGLKSTLLDGRAQLNAALFRTNYEDLQVTTWNGFGFEVGNAAESVTQGVELDGMIRLTEGLTLGGAIAYLDAYYENFDTAPCPATTIAAGTSVCDLSDQPTTYAPEWSGSLYADYFTPLGDKLELRAGLDINYSSEFYYDSDLDQHTRQDSFYKLNARLAIADIDDRWEVALVGKNLNDESTISYGLDMPLVAGGIVGYVEAPREISIQLKASF
ncbi:TonB-dependent receptor [Pseudomaricurvus alkylphenolicus]|uniref:TonB-dependent receptor n=1 Tax=Pseudomaricurvus alkylphenolicus TaxID=1306991 RepID=UPI001421D319|nr:TonB-dependent receptor [Pseudomaricurvus alkylphenolicus]NIB41669.1 TonB-dependent receptor [Pseudomaricurvus alkylphenolicus]